MGGELWQQWLIVAWEWFRNLPGVAHLLGRPLVRIVMDKPSMISEIIDEKTLATAPKSIIFPAKVVNKGASNAENCYPQLLSIITIRGDDYGHPALPLAWEGAKEDDEIVYVEIPPRDESFRFTLARVDCSDFAIIEIPTVRHEEIQARRPIGLGPGEYLVRVNIVGDNFRCPPFEYLVTLDDVGADSWRTLNVRPRPSRLRRFFSQLTRRDSTRSDEAPDSVSE